MILSLLTSPSFASLLSGYFTWSSWAEKLKLFLKQIYRLLTLCSINFALWLLDFDAFGASMAKCSCNDTIIYLTIWQNEVLNLLAKNRCNVEVIVLYFLELGFFPTVFLIFTMWVLERMNIMKHSGETSRLGKRGFRLFVPLFSCLCH